MQQKTQNEYAGDIFSENTDNIAKKIAAYSTTDQKDPSIPLFLNDIMINPQHYEGCDVFKSRHGAEFVQLMKNGVGTDSSRVRDILLFLAFEKFMKPEEQNITVSRDFIMRTSQSGQINIKLYVEEFPYILKSLVSYEFAFHDLMMTTSKKDIEIIRDEITKEKDEIEKKIVAFKLDLDKYEKEAKDIGSNFNFIILSKAFQDLAAAEGDNIDRHAKVADKWKNIAMSIPVISLVLAAIIIGIGGWTKEALSYSAVVVPASLTLTILSIYFFKISHSQYRSAVGVKMQYDHRRSLCQFIQKYSEFSQSVKDHTKLDKFEALIFGGITPDPGSIPATFDGVEQLVKLFETAKKAG